MLLLGEPGTVLRYRMRHRVHLAVLGLPETRFYPASCYGQAPTQHLLEQHF